MARAGEVLDCRLNRGNSPPVNPWLRTNLSACSTGVIAAPVAAPSASEVVPEIGLMRSWRIALLRLSARALAPLALRLSNSRVFGIVGSIRSIALRAVKEVDEIANSARRAAAAAIVRAISAA